MEPLKHGDVVMFQEGQTYLISERKGASGMKWYYQAIAGEGTYHNGRQHEYNKTQEKELFFNSRLVCNTETIFTNLKEIVWKPAS
jgi:hypothetical protein